MRLIENLNPKKWVKGIFFCSMCFFVSCGVENTRRNVENETETNVRFLESIGEKHYSQAIKYFSGKTKDKLDNNEVINFFNQIDDSLGRLINYELIKTKSAFNSRSGENLNNIRSYTYLVNFERRDSLYFTIFYDTKNQSEIGRIADFAIDEAPDN